MIYLYPSMRLYLPTTIRSTEPQSSIHHIFLHVTNMEALLQFITLPLAVLGFVTLISLSYQKATRLNVSPAIQQFLINIHAIATEGCQLALVVIAITNTKSCIETYIDMVGRRVVSSTKAATMIELFVLLSLFLHKVAIYAVDLIEAWILLGDTTAAHKWQPLILTKSLIFSILQKRRNKRLRQQNARRKADATRIIKDHVVSKALTRPRPSKLDYLDLAIPEPVRQAAETDHQPPILRSDNSSRSDRSLQQLGKHLTEDVLTPPDSNQLKDTERVKWAPTISVLSPTGVERRMSLP